MNKALSPTVYGCAFVLLSVASHAWGEDWPQYRGAQGDGISSETVANVDWKNNPPKVLWRRPTPLGFSSFSVADGRAYTLVGRPGADGETREVCLALDADSGRELWSVTMGQSEYGHDGGNAGAPENRGGDGPRSTPTTDGKFVWVFDAHMVLRCFHAVDGKLAWKRDVINEFDGRQVKWFNAISPLLVGDMIFVGGGGKGQSFLAFDKNSGQVVWESGDETMTHATPRIANIGGVEQVIYFVQSGLVSVRADNGKELWRAAFPFSVSTAASPVVDGNRVYCSAGYGVGALAVQLGPNFKVEELWYKPNQLMNHWSTPVARDGYLYGLYEFKKYGKAPLQCVELSTGEIQWASRGFGPGNCILVGDKLVVLSDGGDVVLVDPVPGKYHERARFKAVDGKCWSTPAYSDGRIYVRSTKEAVCLVVD